MKIFMCLLFAMSISISEAQTIPDTKSKLWFDTKNNFHKHRAYIFWGYNREKFSTTDLHIHGKGYDFTLYNAAAHDRPEKFNLKVYLLPWYMTIPQYNCHGGFFIKNNLHLSFGNDHMKYVITENQTVKISGAIDSSISELYGGLFLKSDRVLTKDFLRFEHTNGLNLYTINLEYLLPVFHSVNDKFHIGINGGIGGFVVLTKTDIHYFGLGLDNHFHVSGICFPVNIGPRIEYGPFFIGAELKTGYMFLPWIILQNNNIDLANQNFSFFEKYAFAGLAFPIGRKKG